MAIFWFEKQVSSGIDGGEAMEIVDLPSDILKTIKVEEKSNLERLVFRSFLVVDAKNKTAKDVKTRFRKIERTVERGKVMKIGKYQRTVERNIQ